MPRKRMTYAELKAHDPYRASSMRYAEAKRKRIGGLSPDDEPKPLFSEPIRAWLERRNLKTVALKSGISHRRFVHFLRGDADLRLVDMDRLATAYGLAAFGFTSDIDFED